MSGVEVNVSKVDGMIAPRFRGTARTRHAAREIARAEEGVESRLGCVPAASAVDQALHGDEVDVGGWGLGGEGFGDKAQEREHWGSPIPAYKLVPESPQIEELHRIKLLLSAHLLTPENEF